MARQLIYHPGPADLPPTADVVILGAGPAGAAAAWALHRAAPHLRSVLLEASDHLGAGSSTASLEAFRTCWAAECLAAQMQRSAEVFLHADDYLGEGAAAALDIRQQGYLFCAFGPGQVATLQADVAHFQQIGMRHIEFLQVEELRYRFPWLGEAVIAAKYDPSAGWLDSNSLIQRYIQQAANCRVLLNMPQCRIQQQGGRVTGVETPQGSISSPAVILAAGAGSRALAQSAGLELPLLCHPRQSFTSAWRHYPGDAPMIIGAAPSAHTHATGGSDGGAIFGWEYHWNSKHLSPGHVSSALVEPVFPTSRLQDPRFPSITLLLLARQFGHRGEEGFASPRYLRGIRHTAGYYVSRDGSSAYRQNAAGEQQPYHSERAILDEHPELRGLFLSVAHGGHGVMSSPAAGESIAALVLGQPLPDPRFADFGWGVPWVAHDDNGL